MTTTRDLLHRILSQPTAPFREKWVAREIARILDEHDIPWFQDAAGNLIAGLSSVRQLKAGFRLGLIAHMDHPGFHITRSLNPRRRLHEAVFWGGGPLDAAHDAAIRVFSHKTQGFSMSGRIRAVSPPPGQPGHGRTLVVELEQALTPAQIRREEYFGGFDFPGIRISGQNVKTRAADDLAGCVIALGALLDQTKNPRGAPLFVCFTRAEEVGFVGCLALLEEGYLSPERHWILSLEASKELPEAILGRGPVLRTGDRTMLFDPAFSALAWDVAREMEATTAGLHDPFVFQRRLMSGGSCEATPLCLYGFTATGLAVPLRNYHNGARDGRPAPEHISAADVEGARRFCVALAKALPKPPPWRQSLRKRIVTHYRQLKKHLRSPVEAR